MNPDILKRIGPLQDLLFSLPFFDLAKRRLIQREQYVAFLRAIAIITESLEGELLRLSADGAAPLWNAAHRRGPLYEQDLRCFHAPMVADLPATFEQAQKMASTIRLRGLERPGSLIGYLLVLELVMTRLAELADAIKTSLGLTAGLDWLQVVNVSAVLESTSSAEPDIEAGMREALEGLSRVITSIYPERDDTRRILVTSINPEAGRHPIPEDPRELEAALAAGEACWNRFPYYRARYGERGRRFTGSDSAWIATLISLQQPEIDRQIDWLADFLVLRGMPRITMEAFLESLGHELLVRVPEKGPAIRKLQRTAERLRERRLSVFPAAISDQVIAGFERESISIWPEAIPNMGILLVSALADDVTGVPGAEKALVEWLTEPGRFPEAWAGLVERTLASAREKMTVR